MAAKTSQKPGKPVYIWQPVILINYCYPLAHILTSRVRVAVSPFDFPTSRSGGDFYIILNDRFVLTARQFDGFPQGQLSLSDPQRTWASISLQDVVTVRLYDPFQEGGHRYLASVDAEVGFAGRKTTETPFDQDDLASLFTKVFRASSVYSF